MTCIAIAGASGQLGQAVARHLLDRVDPRSLVLVTRQPSALRHLAALGAQVRAGDYDDPASLRSAFAGATRLLLISATDLSRRTQQHLQAIDAALEARVGHVVYTSMLRPDAGNPAVITPSHRATEEALKNSRCRWTILRNSLYADYQVAEATQAAATGELIHNRGNGRIAYVAREDCAAVAAAVLGGDGHGSRTYDVTGPELYDSAALALLYSRLSGRTVKARSLDDEAFVAHLMEGSGDAGHARFGAELVASFGRAIRDGWFDVASDTVSQLTGRPATALAALLAQGLSTR